MLILKNGMNMFTLPNNSFNQACIIGIDPGTETMGVAIMYIDVATLNILEIRANTYRGSLLPQDRMLGLTYGDRAARIHAHEQNLIELFKLYSPVAIVSEAPFFNPRMPDAYAALVEAVSAIGRAVFAYSDVKPLYKVPPSNVKQAIGAKGNADKPTMKATLLSIAEISNAIKDAQYLDEHCIDAIAVAYHRLKCYRGDILVF